MLMFFFSIKTALHTCIVLFYVDVSGVGLMEIVTKPDFSNGTEAASFVRELQLILKTVGSCNCKMNGTIQL